jgi:hypothetical protein
LRSNLPINEGDCFVLKDAGAIAHYAPRNDIFIGRGAAAGMGACPENRPAGLTQRRKGRQGLLSSSDRLCVLASLRELFMRRGAAAGMGN